MTIRRFGVELGDNSGILFEAGARVELDLTSAPWHLRDGQASVVVGLDVTRTGGIRPGGGRKMLGVSLPVADRDVTAAGGIAFRGRTAVRYRRLIGTPHPFDSQGGYVTRTSTGATYDDVGGANGDHSVTKTNAFSTYEFRAGDRLVVTAPAANKGVYQIAAKIGSNEILLQSSAGADTSTMKFSLERFPALYHTLEGTFTAETALMKSTFLHDLEGGWPAEMVGAVVVFNADSRMSSSIKNVARRIESISTTMLSDDTINWTDAVSGGNLAETDKVSIVYAADFDRRGIWVTNGRKFWLLRDGAYTLYLDLGDDTYKGTVWHGARIANSLLMFVSPKYPPRILSLSRGPSSSAAENDTLAGLVPPVKPLIEDNETTTSRSWVFARDAANGSVSEGTIRAKVRAVNLETGGQSEFVDVYGTSGSSLELAVTAGDTVAVYNKIGTGDDPPPLHERWTHIELWRTRSLNDGVYFLERRVEIADLRNEEADATIEGTPIRSFWTLTSETPGDDGLGLSDVELTGFPQLSNAELLAGGLPPICRRVASLRGVTLCFGRSDADAADATLYSRPIYATDLSWSVSSPDHYLTRTNAFFNYTVKSGDQFVVTYGDDSAELGVFDILSRIGAHSISLAESIASANVSPIAGYIRRPYTVPWPRIESDEDVWYSRTDTFAPESFPARTLQISASGDVFRNAVPVGNYVAVIMAGGVHLLYLTGGGLQKNEISSGGDGTPWEDSVVVIGRSVLWATEDGPKVLSVSNDPDQAGHRGRIEFLDGEGRMRQWFRDAFAAGQRIDAGVDVLNRTIRWRRTIDDNTFETLQYSYRTNLWTLIEDDNGIRYASSRVADVEESATARLYSVTVGGEVAEVNYSGTADPYAGLTPQAVTGNQFEVSANRIRRIAESGETFFSSLMSGDMVRFRSENDAVDGVSRVIRTASDNVLTFDSVAGLALGDELLIGATRFRVRFAPMRGAHSSSVKTLEGLNVRLATGDRLSETQTRRMSVRGIEDFNNLQVDPKLRSIDVVNPSDAAYTTADRIVSLQKQGASIEIELECIETRTDFVIELVEAEFNEAGDIVIDTSTEA